MQLVVDVVVILVLLVAAVDFVVVAFRLLPRLLLCLLLLSLASNLVMVMDFFAFVSPLLLFRYSFFTFGLLTSSAPTF
jgi:hypothetical protein